MIDAALKPALSSKARLRFDRHAQRYMLLYPEKGLVLNETGAEIAKLCTGEHSVAEIAERLSARWPEVARERIDAELDAFLHALLERALIRDAR